VQAANILALAVPRKTLLIARVEITRSWLLTHNLFRLLSVTSVPFVVKSAGVQKGCNSAGGG
jgi:hypothetical protein